MPSGKGLVPEHHPQFIGTYWGAISTNFCGEIVESADAYLFAGPIFNDYSTVGYSLLIKKEKSIIVQPNRVTVGMIEDHLINWYIFILGLVAIHSITCPTGTVGTWFSINKKSFVF